MESTSSKVTEVIVCCKCTKLGGFDSGLNLGVFRVGLRSQVPFLDRECLLFGDVHLRNVTNVTRVVYSFLWKLVRKLRTDVTSFHLQLTVYYLPHVHKEGLADQSGILVLLVKCFLVC